MKALFTIISLLFVQGVFAQNKNTYKHDSIKFNTVICIFTPKGKVNPLY